ncbi:hypothetical protein IAT40_005316 [Kwoniella sp. CBS 6097]
MAEEEPMDAAGWEQKARDLAATWSKEEQAGILSGLPIEQFFGEETQDEDKQAQNVKSGYFSLLELTKKVRKEMSDKPGQGKRKTAAKAAPATAPKPQASAKGKKKASAEDEGPIDIDSELSPVPSTDSGNSLDEFHPDSGTSGSSGSGFEHIGEGEDELSEDDSLPPTKKAKKATKKATNKASVTPKASFARETTAGPSKSAAEATTSTPRATAKSVAPSSSSFSIAPSPTPIVDPTPSKLGGHHLAQWKGVAAAVEGAIKRWNNGHTTDKGIHMRNYNKPVLVEISKYGQCGLQVAQDEVKDCWMEYLCHVCGENVYQQANDSSGGKLRTHPNKHATTKRQSTQVILPAGTAAMTESRVLFYALINCAVHNRSFQSVTDLLIKQLCHSLPGAIEPPTPRLVSTHTVRFFNFVRARVFEGIRNRMAGHLHLAVDGWSSPNHQSYLGVVGSWHEEISPNQFQVKTAVIDFVHTEGSATGVAMASQISHLLETAGLQEEVFSITLDNASANDVLVDELGENESLVKFPGATHRVRCFAHVLNLVVKALLSPFNSATTLSSLQAAVKRQIKADKNSGLVDEEDLYGEEEAQDNPLARALDVLTADWDGADEGLDLSNPCNTEDGKTYINPDDNDQGGLDGAAQVRADVQILNQQVDHDLESTPSSESSVEGGALMLSNLVKKVKERDVAAGRKMLSKIRALARVLCYNKTLRAAWNRIIAHETKAGRYNGPQRVIQRDIETRWNTTGDMIGLCMDMKLVVLAFYKDKAIQADKNAKVVFDKPNQLSELDWKTMAALRPVLTFFKTATIRFQYDLSRPIVTVASVVPYLDEVTKQLDKILLDEKVPVMVRVGCCVGKNLANKYYSRSDESIIYRLAILLHPSMRMRYLTSQKWLEDWKQTARDLLHGLYESQYQTESESLPPDSSPVHEPGMIELELDDDERTSKAHPIDTFIDGDRIKGPNNTHQDPIQWWSGCVEERYKDLRKLALDIFSTPATSVEPKRIFSTAGLTVSNRRHSLGPGTVPALMCLASWYKRGLVTYNDWEAYVKAQREKEKQ